MKKSTTRARISTYVAKETRTRAKGSARREALAEAIATIAKWAHCAAIGIEQDGELPHDRPWIRETLERGLREASLCWCIGRYTEVMWLRTDVWTERDPRTGEIRWCTETGGMEIEEAVGPEGETTEGRPRVWWKAEQQRRSGLAASNRSKTEGKGWDVEIEVFDEQPPQDAHTLWKACVGNAAWAAARQHRLEREEAMYTKGTPATAGHQYVGEILKGLALARVCGVTLGGYDGEGLLDEREVAPDAVRRKMDAALERLGMDIDGLVGFNDSADTTHADVLGLYDRAIGREREQHRRVLGVFDKAIARLKAAGARAKGSEPEQDGR